MRNYQAYEWNDLSKEVQDKIKEELTNEQTAFELDQAYEQITDKTSDQEYQNIIGCSKYYAESTAWFVPSCYYNQHKKEIDEVVQEIVQAGLYTKSGTRIAPQS